MCTFIFFWFEIFQIKLSTSFVIEISINKFRIVFFYIAGKKKYLKMSEENKKIEPTNNRREPKVIVFRETNRALKSFSNKSLKRKLQNTDQNVNNEETNFVTIAREVKEFGITGFTKKEQKKSMQRYAEHLGARKFKAQKVPYKMLMERKKTKAEKEKKIQSMERSMGVFRKKRKEDNVKLTQKLNLGRWVDKSSIGNFSKNNMVKVKKNDIKKYTK